MAFFVAFYSYKGGVGRTLALANTAYALAARGKRIVVLDMDLEAPDLLDHTEFSLEGKGVKKGVVDFAVACARTGKCPPIKSFVHRCKEAPGTGQLWLMPAGSVGSAYQHQIGKLHWRRLHPAKGTAPFIEGLRHALVEQIQPHYVLIDSRTGLSDIGGLSTHRLADMVVLVFNLTRSCIDGSVRTYRSFVANESTRLVQLVASPVPPVASEEGSLIERRLSEAAEKMPLGFAYGRSILRIEYDPAMVLSEELAVRKPESFPAAAARYEELREIIQRANPDEIFFVLEQAQALRREGRVEEALASMREFVSSHDNDVEAHLALANSLLETRRAAEAVRVFTRVCTLQPDTALPHRRLGEALIAAGETRAAFEELSVAARLGDESPELFLALARVLASRDELAQEIEARRRAVLSVLGPMQQARSHINLEELASEFLKVMDQRPHIPGFRALSFGEDVLRSLTLSNPEKGEIYRQVLESRLSSEDVTLLSHALRDEALRWLDLLGPEAAELQKRIAREMIDPRELEALAHLGGESQLGPVINKFFSLMEGELPLPTEAVFFSGILGETGEYAIPPMRLSSLANLARGMSISADNLVDAQFWRRQGGK